MILGLCGIVFFTLYEFAIHPIVMGILCSVVSYIALSLLTPPQSKEVIDAFMQRIGRLKQKESEGKTITV